MYTNKCIYNVNVSIWCERTGMMLNILVEVELPVYPTNIIYKLVYRNE